MDFPRQTLALEGGGQLSFHQVGNGRDVVPIHGMITTSQEMVIALADALLPRYRVTAFDRPGFGQSTRLRFEASPQQQAALLLEGMRQLRLQNPIVVGHSLGGTVALTAAILDPGAVAGVVAIAPIVSPEPRLEHVVFGGRATPGLGDVASLVDGVGMDTAALPLLWRAMFLPQDMPQRFRDEFSFAEVTSGKAMLATAEDALATTAGLALNLPGYLHCRVPAVVITGDRDLVVSPERHGRPVAAMLPEGRLVSAPGMGHMLHHFEPWRVVEAVGSLG